MDPIHDNFAGSNPQDGGSLMPNDRLQNPAGPVVGGEPQNPVVAQNPVAPQEPVGNPPVVAQDSMTQKNSVTPQDPAITRQNPVISQNPVMRQNSTATNEMRANIQNILNNNNTNLNVPVGSDGGDVVLSNAQPKNKRLTIIVAVIVALVLFGVGLWYVLSSGLLSGKSGVVSDFNRFANYVLYGEDSDKAISDSYDEDKDYYFLAKQETEEDRKALYKKASELFDVFFEKYNGFENKAVLSKDIPALDSYIYDEKYLLDFINLVYIKEPLNEIMYIKNYVTFGKDVADSYVMNYYQLSSEGDNQYIVDFNGALNDWLINEEKYLDYYLNNGCIANDLPSNACMLRNESVNMQQLDELRESKDDSFGEFRTYYNFLENVVYNVYVIDGIMNNKDISSMVLYGEEGVQDETD